jgi:hypothetical protein
VRTPPSSPGKRRSRSPATPARAASPLRAASPASAHDASPSKRRAASPSKRRDASPVKAAINRLSILARARGDPPPAAAEPAAVYLPPSGTDTRHSSEASLSGHLTLKLPARVTRRFSNFLRA